MKLKQLVEAHNPTPITDYVAYFSANDFKHAKYIDAFNAIDVESFLGGPLFVDGDVDIRGTNISSLEHGPKNVKQSFLIANTPIDSLEHSPDNVLEEYDASDTNITNLVGITPHIGGELILDNCRNLESLEGSPYSIDKIKITRCNRLKSLKGIQNVVRTLWVSCPIETLDDIDILISPRIFGLFQHKLKTFKNIHRSINPVSLYLDASTDVKDGFLSLTQIKSLTKINMAGVELNTDTYSIDHVTEPFVKAVILVNKSIAEKDNLHERLYHCQDLLIDAGLEEYANI